MGKGVRAACCRKGKSNTEEQNDICLMSDDSNNHSISKPNAL